jgi:hypothetical protein
VTCAAAVVETVPSVVMPVVAVAVEAPPNNVPEKNLPMKLEPISVPLKAPSSAVFKPPSTFLISGSSKTD